MDGMNNIEIENSAKTNIISGALLLGGFLTVAGLFSLGELYT